MYIYRYRYCMYVGMIIMMMMGGEKNNVWM